MAQASNLKRIVVSNFYGGISDDPRKKTLLEFVISKHFDIFSDPNKLSPYRDFEADTNDDSSATGMKQYAIKDGLYHSASSKLFGLGKTLAGLTKIFYKADATTGNWTLPASSEGTGAVQNGCLVEYKDYLWGFQSTNSVFKWGLISGSPSITNAAGSTATTISSIAQGLIGKDDNLYLPYNNILMRVTSGGTVNDAVLTLPSNYKITSLAKYGNYLAIACAPVSTFNGVSSVFLWNYSSPDVQETIDWGEGELRILENIEGMLVGITDRFLNNATGAGQGSMIIKVYQGGTPQVIKEVFTQALTGKTIPLSKAVKNNRLFFAAKIMTNSAGTEYNEGIWSFGRKNVNYPFTSTLDLIDENINTSGIQGFASAANYFFIFHSGDGSIDKTNDSASYTFTSILETQFYNFDDPYLSKQLQNVSVLTTPLLAGQAVVVKYKANGDSAWTTIGTFDDDGELSRDFYHVELAQGSIAAGDAFSLAKEYKLRFESTGGAEITGYAAEALLLTGSVSP